MYGYTCPTCGKWVPNGTYHTCGQPQAYNWCPYYGCGCDSLLPVLERIAKALESLVEKKNETPESKPISS